MMIEKREVIDKIEILPETGVIQIRTAILVEEDGEVIARSHQRRTIAPGDKVSHEPADIKAVCARFQTDAKITAWRDRAARRPPDP